MSGLILAGMVAAIIVATASCIGLGIAAHRQSVRRRRRTYISGKA